MKKAEKIFKDTYTECRLHVKAWGLEYNPNGKAVGFTGVITEEPVCNRTLNEIQKYIDSENYKLDCYDRMGVGDKEKHDFWRDALKMVQSTVDNSRDSIRKFNEMLKA